MFENKNSQIYLKKYTSCTLALPNIVLTFILKDFLEPSLKACGIKQFPSMNGAYNICCLEYWSE